MMSRYAVILLLLFSLGLTSCQKKKEDARVSSYPVHTAKALATALENYVEAPGNVVAQKISEVSSTITIPCRVRLVHVKEGERVSEGQRLLDLDMYDLRTQMQQQAAVLESSRVKHDQARTGYSYQADQTDNSIQQARKNLESARTRLDQARKNLDYVRAQTKEQINNARAALDTAKANLVRTAAPTRPQDLAQAKAQIEQATHAVEAAKANYAKLQAGYREQEVREAKAAVDQAESAREAAKANLRKLQAGYRSQDVEQAKAAVEQAKSNLDKAKKDLARATQLYKNGAIPAQQEDAAKNAYEVALAQEEKSVQAYELQKEGYQKEDIESARTQVSQAEAALARAKEDYDLRKEGYRKEDIDGALAQVKQAESELRKAQEYYDLLKEGPRKEDIDAAQAQVKQAETSLALAMTGEKSVKVKEDDVKTAFTAYQQAKLSYDLALSGTKQNKMKFDDVRAYQASIDQTRAALDYAANQVRNASISSPISGIIIKRDVEVGDTPGKDPLFEIHDTRTVWLQVFLDETWSKHITVGKAATVTAEALPGRTFNGVVDEINPATSAQSKTFKVKVKVDNPSLTLKSGMYAKVRILISRKSNAIVVPPEAVITKNDRNYVFIVDGGAAKRIEVTTGLMTKEQAEILSGNITPGADIITLGAEDFAGGEKVTISNRN